MPLVVQDELLKIVTYIIIWNNMNNTSNPQFADAVV